MALIRAGRPDLTAEAIVADADAPWASEFSADDRTAARSRLDSMLQAHQTELEAAETAAVEHDRKIVDDVNSRRIAKGNPPLTPKQKLEMLERLSSERRSA
jgi:hypothetical protein